MLFFLLKTLKPEDLAECLDSELSKLLIGNIVGLLRDKKPYVKNLGIKISSYMQYLSENEDYSELIYILKFELLKLMCSEEDDNVRNNAVTNVDLNDSTFCHLVRRVRDKSLNIR